MASKDNQDSSKNNEQKVSTPVENKAANALSEPNAEKDSAPVIEKEKTVKRASNSQHLTRSYFMTILGCIIIFYIGYVVWSHYQASKQMAGKPEQLSSKIERGAKLKESVKSGDIKDKKYAELLLKREQMNADKAARTGRSNIPSVLSAKAAANDFGSSFQMKNNGGNQSKKNSTFSAISPECKVDALVNAKKAGVIADELRCKGCNAKSLREAGYTAGSLFEAGYSANALKKAGFKANDLARAGYDLDRLKAADFPLVGKDNSIESTSPSVAALKKAGYGAKDLKTIGLSDSAIYKACYTVSSLINAGYTTMDLLKIGYLPVELYKAGVSVSALENAGVSNAAIKAAGLVVMHYKKCPQATVLAGRSKGVKATEWLAKGCAPAVLKKVGYSLGELLDAGVGIPEIAKLNYSGRDMAEAGIAVSALRKAGIPLSRLVGRYSFNLSTLKKAGYPACQLKQVKIDPTALHLAGYSAKELMDAGFDTTALRKAGLSAAKLLRSGTSVHDLLGAGFGLKDLNKAGVSADALYRAGISASDAKKAGYSASDLHLAGYGYGDLVRAGFAAKTLEKAGIAFSDKKECVQQYIQAQRKQGVSLSFFKHKGCNAASLNKAGYTWKQLKKAGFGPSLLHVAGASLSDLKKLFTADQLADAGIGTNALAHSVGRLHCDRLSIGKAVKEGISARSFLVKGCGPAVLHAGGYSLGDLRNAGFDALALKEAGFSNKDIVSAGFSAAKLKAAGITDKPLNAALESQINEGKGGPSSQEALLRKQLEDNYSQMNKQQQEQAIKKLQGAMKADSKKLMADWRKSNRMGGDGIKMDDIIKLLPSSAASQGDLSGKHAKKDVITYNQSPLTKGKSPKTTFIKAGSISYAVIDNFVSSDNSKTPVLATVVEGPLKGSRLIGSFATNKELMTITFTKISLPWRDQSASINVVAIDPDTAEAALASSVDHHYWKKYGIQFAAAFIQGMGTAVNNASSTVSSSIGTYTFQTAGLTMGEKVLSALGQVGSTIGSNIDDISDDVDTTVNVDAGTSIGLLFTSDYEIPQ